MRHVDYFTLKFITNYHDTGDPDEMYPLAYLHFTRMDKWVLKA